MNEPGSTTRHAAAQVAGMVILIRGKGPPPPDFRPDPNGIIQHEFEMSPDEAAEFRRRSPGVPVTIIDAKAEPLDVTPEPAPEFEVP
jgi:hypothetical protein